MYDIIIVGAGPAGLTAALYARRANKSVLLLESKSYGGQIINAHLVENYPGVDSISGFDLATSMFKQAINKGADIKYETVVNITKDLEVTTNKNTYKGRSIILATGAQNRKLNLPNETEFIGKGVSYCATCDGNFYKGKDVAIVGGGNTALEDALYLSDIANKVYLIHRRDTFRGEDKYIEEINNRSNIEVLTNSVVESINGTNLLESITLNDNRTLNVAPGAFDEKKRALLSIAGSALKYPFHVVNRVLEAGAHIIGHVATLPLHLVSYPINLLFKPGSPYTGKVVEELGDKLSNFLSTGVRAIDRGIKKI